MNFVCTCGCKIDLKDQTRVSAHMGLCDNFIFASPLRQAFDLQRFNTFNVDQLLMFRADICSWVHRIRQLLDEKGCRLKEPQQYSLESYSKFTQKRDRESDSQLKVTTTEPQISADTKNKQNNRKLENQSESDKQKEKQKAIVDRQRMDLEKHHEDLKNDELIDDHDDEEESENSIRMKNLDLSMSMSDYKKCSGCNKTTFDQSNMLIPIGCGDNMCQSCFVQLYRGDHELVCFKQTCRQPLDVKFIKEATKHSNNLLCLICWKSFLQSNVKRHIMNMHTGPNRKFSCGECVKLFTNYQDFRTHKLQKHPQLKSKEDQNNDMISLYSGSGEKK